MSLITIGFRGREYCRCKTTYLKYVPILYLVLYCFVFCHNPTHDGIPVERDWLSTGHCLADCFTFSMVFTEKKNDRFIKSEKTNN